MNRLQDQSTERTRDEYRRAALEHESRDRDIQLGNTLRLAVLGVICWVLILAVAWKCAS